MIEIKRVKVRLPSGRVVLRIKRKKPKVAKCALCKKPLHGMMRKQPIELKKMAKSEKRPERAYGGFLCSACSRELFRERMREKFGER